MRIFYGKGRYKTAGSLAMVFSSCSILVKAHFACTTATSVKEGLVGSFVDALLVFGAPKYSVTYCIFHLSKQLALVSYCS